MTTPVTRADLELYRVKLTHPDHHSKTVFSSVSLTRARAYVEKRFPRGSEAYLLYPDGRTFSFEAERQGDMGMDADAWQEYDPASFVPVGHGDPPGDNVWSDKEG